MPKITAFVLAHKKLVAIGWLLLTLVGVVAAGPANNALDQKFTVPGREGFETNQKIVKTYHSGGDAAPIVAVASLPKGKTVNSPGVGAQLKAVEGRLAKSAPGGRVAGFASTGDKAFVSKDGRTTFAYLFPPPSGETFNDNGPAAKKTAADLRGAEVAGAPVRVTGFDALSNDAGSDDSGGPGVLLEAVFGGLGALVVLVFVFGSSLALVPLGMAISSVLVTFLLLFGLTTITDVSPIVSFLVALIGLGVSIDYALIVVVRWREEREKGLEGDEAVAAAMHTAGRAVVFSGTTVAIGLLALIVLPLPFFRSVGYGGMFVPLVATLAAITLLPVILAKFGARMDKRRIRRRDRSHAGWERWSRLIVRNRLAAVAVAVVILGALMWNAFGLQLGNSDPDTIAKAGPAKVGLSQIKDSGIGPGALSPIEMLTSKDTADGLAADTAKAAGVHGTTAPTGPSWQRGGTALVMAMPRLGDDTSTGRDTVQDVRAAAHASTDQARVGGTGAANADFIDAVYGSFPLMIGLIALVTFVLLARAFRSLLLPLKAVLLNVLSIGAAWGAITLVWQHGHGSEALWGISATGSVAAWIPFMVFAFLYGLSMDYEVFILARMREQYDLEGDTDSAVVTGLGRTGRLVTSAALILFLTFVSMASGPETDVKILATGLAVGIAIDATVIRALLVPAVVSLMGKWNWWMPAWSARLLRVAPSE